MQIELENLNATVVHATAKEREWLRGFLAFEDHASRFQRRRDGSIKVGAAKRISMLKLDDTFPAGLVSKVRRAALQKSIPVHVLDRRVRPCAPMDWATCLPPALVQPDGTPWLYDFQQEAVEAAIQRTRGILDVPTGGGKCLAPETLVLHYAGHVTRADQVCVGDDLMGPDSKPRRVKSVTHGVGPRYRITPKKGDAWECNDVHVLTLKHTQTGEIVDIPLNEYLNKSKTFRHLHKQFGVGVDFPEPEQLPVDPYFIGLWMGDGRKSLAQVEVTKDDPEIVAYLDAMAEGYDLAELKGNDSNGTRCTSWRIVTPMGQPNPLLEEMRRLFPSDGYQRRPVPKVLTCSRRDRMQILAGVVDTDGHLGNGYYEVSQKPGPISDAIAFIARSLGFRVTHATKTVNGVDYDRWNILGSIDRIPCRVERKKAKPRRINKDAQNVGFSVEKVSDAAPYFGFTLNGDGRFLLGDFQVSHNTEIACGIAMRLGMTNTLFVAPEADLMHNAARRWEKRTGLEAGRIGDGWMKPLDGLTSATFQTLSKRLEKGDAKLQAYLKTVGCVIFDEVHTLPASSFYLTAQQIPAYWRIGVSGTPLARGDRKSLFSIAATGSIIYKVPTQLLIDRGFISRPHIQMVPCEQDSTAKGWQAAEKELIVESKKRNRLVVAQALVAPKPGLVFVKLKKHGRALTDMLKAAGLRVEFVWGEKNTSQRDDAIKRLQEGRLDVIVCSVVFQTGTDIPEVRSMVIACGGKSEIATLQRIGRGMRIVKDDFGKTIKDEFWVFDVMDREPQKHAGHTGNRWNARHSRERFKAYTGVGHEVTIKETP